MKKIMTAAIVAICFCAKAQSIEVIAPCDEVQTLNFQKQNARGEVLANIPIGSHCPQQQIPAFRLEPGNYLFPLLDPRLQWYCEIRNENGKLVKGGNVQSGFWTLLFEKQKITLYVVPPMVVYGTHTEGSKEE